MTTTENPNFTCEVCGREGAYSDFLDLNNDEVDPWQIYNVCPQCHSASQKHEIWGTILIPISILPIPFLGFQIEDQIPTFAFCYTLNLARKLYFSFFLFQKIRADNTANPKEFLFSKLRDQIFLFLLTPLDLLTSPFRLISYRKK